MRNEDNNIVKPGSKENILCWLCIAFVYSMLFWTLLNSILAILIVAFWLFFLKKEFNLHSGKSKRVLLFCSLYFISLLGLFYSDNINYGINLLQKQSALFFFPLVFGTISLSSSILVKKLIPHFIIATTLACIAGMAVGLYYYISSAEIKAITGRDLLLFPGFNPIIMGMYCLLALVFIFTFDFATKPRIKKWLLAIAIIFSVYIFLISIRMIIFCWAAFVFYFLWKKIKNKFYKYLITTGLIFSLLITGLIFKPLKKQWKELFDLSRNNSIVLDKDSSLGRSWGGKAIRIAIWSCSTDIIKANWLIGVGTGDTQDKLQQAYENRKFYFASRYNQYNAHNQYLQFAITSGIIGLLSFSLCLITPFFQYKLKNTDYVYLLFIILFATVSLTESTLEVNKGIIFYSFFNSIFSFTNFKT